jgi:non-specific serine/threonine protein kinase
MEALDPTTRTSMHVLTLVGVAGSGKSRLALQVAELVREAYRDGVWLVELAPLPANPAADPAPLAAATLAALGLHEQSGQAMLETLVSHLRTRRVLLVLDNCEHLVAACAAMAARLQVACSEVQILATSQSPLGAVNETVWPVAPLGVPPLVDGTPTPEARVLVGKHEAVQLFMERAQAMQPGFVLDAATAGSVAAICRQLDGLPLAIELATARLHVLPVEEIRARLDDRFRLLRRGGRSAAGRHQALQATMDWSYGLLDRAGQAVLRRLAVFTSGWDVAAAEAVCAGEEVAVEAVLELLDDLLDRSLVYLHETGAAPRYGMLETVRQYGLQQMERAGDLAVVRDRHLRWCVALAEQAAPAMVGPEQIAWLERLEREHDNVRAAMQWALDRGLSAPGLRLAAGLWQFWRSRRRHLGEGRRWLAAVLALAVDEDDATSIALRASALKGAAWLAEDEHDFAHASAMFAQSDALRRALGQDERATSLLINEAMEARAGGDYVRATALLEESVARQRALGNRESINRGGLGLSLSRLALVLAEQGEYAQATALYEECVGLHRELHDREGEGYALLGLGDIARDQGETGRVRVYCEEGLAIFRELGHPLVGFALNNLALAACLDGDLALATARAQESEAFFREVQAEPNLAEVLVTVGRVKGAQGQGVAARASLTEALRLARAKGPRWVVAAALEELGAQAVQHGQARHGAHLLAAAARLREVMGAPVRPADRRALEDALATAEVTLGATAYADAWSAGQALPLEQIVARAGDEPALSV